MGSFMKRIYLLGQVEPNLQDILDYLPDTMVLHETLSVLVATTNKKAAMTIKLRDIRASELIVCFLPQKYSMTAEDVFTLSFAAGLGKQLAFVSEMKEVSPHIIFFEAFPYLVFNDLDELVEYIRLDVR